MFLGESLAPKGLTLSHCLMSPLLGFCESGGNKRHWAHAQELLPLSRLVPELYRWLDGYPNAPICTEHRCNSRSLQAKTCRCLLSYRAIAFDVELGVSSYLASLPANSVFDVQFGTYGSSIVRDPLSRRVFLPPSPLRSGEPVSPLPDGTISVFFQWIRLEDAVALAGVLQWIVDR